MTVRWFKISDKNNTAVSEHRDSWEVSKQFVCGDGYFLFVREVIFLAIPSVYGIFT